MYLGIKCKCVDLVLELTPKQILNAYKQKSVCPECHTKYKLKPMLRYDKTKYISPELLNGEMK